MKSEKKLLLWVSLILFGNANAQVGIETNSPKATIDIRTKNNYGTEKAIKIANSEDSEVFTLYNNGNVQFKGALMPNDNPGQPGQYLVSKGPNLAPQWTTISFPDGTKQIRELFSIVSNNLNTSVPANTFSKIKYNTINFPSNNNFDTWNTTDYSFTVKENGIYIISAGCSMYTSTLTPSSSGAMRIYTGDTFFEFGTITTQSSDGTLFWDNSNGELVRYLNAGDKIWIEAQAIHQWSLANAFLHIKYIQL